MKTFDRLIHAGFEYQIVVFRIDGGNMIAQGRGSQKLWSEDGPMSKQGSRTQIVRMFWWTTHGLYEFWNKGSDGGQFEDIEVTEIILGVGESYDVKIILPDITDAKAVSYTHLTLPTNREV